MQPVFTTHMANDLDGAVTRSQWEDTEVFIRKTFETDPQQGLELVFKRYYKPLCSHALRFVYGKQIAEDLVADVFYTFWQKGHYQHITTSFRAYLFAAVRHRAYAYLKQEFDRVPNSTYDPLEQVSPLPDPNQTLQYDELYLKIEKTIQSLPPQSQRVFLLSRFEGKKNQEIADELQIALKTVEAHMSKALSTLRNALKEELWVAVLGIIYFFV